MYSDQKGADPCRNIANAVEQFGSASSEDGPVPLIVGMTYVDSAGGHSVTPGAIGTTNKWGGAMINHAENRQVLQVPGYHSLPGEKKLALAVLEDALRNYLEYDPPSWGFNEASCWILSDERRSPFSFVNVCELFGINPSCLRGKLQRKKRVPY